MTMAGMAELQQAPPKPVKAARFAKLRASGPVVVFGLLPSSDALHSDPHERVTSRLWRAEVPESK